MANEDDFFIADGGPHHDFIATRFQGNAHIGFVTHSEGGVPQFPVGGQFSGTIIGTICAAGIGNDDSTWGPFINSYSGRAGVLGTSNDLTGVAGTSVSNVGVYGQVEEPAQPAEVPIGVRAGVVGMADTQLGVFGWSREADAVQGFSFTQAGVRGVSRFGPAVVGVSGLGPGVVAFGALSGVTGISGRQGPPVPNGPTAGVIGSSADQPGVIGTSDTQIGVLGFSNNVGIVGQTSNPASLAGWFLGNVLVTGTLTATVKNGVVAFPDGTQRLLHCMESPEHWFEDFGAAKLKGGRAVVRLDADFGKIIKSGDYRVFVTPEGDCRGLSVRRKRAASFEVRELMGGTSSIAFSYRIVGRRKDIRAHQRFAKADMRLPLPAAAARPPRTPKPTPAALRAFIARVEKEARERAPKGVKRGRRPHVRPERVGHRVVLPPSRLRRRLAGVTKN